MPWWSPGGSVATPQAAGQADPAPRCETPPAGDRSRDKVTAINSRPPQRLIGPQVTGTPGTLPDRFSL